MRRRLRGAHGGMLGARDADWDSLDEFSPREDTERPEGGKRGNVRAWR